MKHENPRWVDIILNLKDSGESLYFNLNDVAFERLEECKTNSQETISYKIIRSKLCRNFSINKEQCMKLLRYFEALGKIEFVNQKGIRIL